MRFLFVSLIPDHPWSGMGKWSHRLGEELRGLGHDVTLRFADDYPRMRGLGRAAVLLFPVLLAAELIWQRRSFDVAVIHEPIGFWYGVARRLSRRLPPMLLVCHNVESRHFCDLLAASERGFARVTWSSRLKYALFRRWQSDGAIRLADAVLCLSTIDQRYLRRFNPNVTATVNGADAGTERASRLDVRRVLFVGGWLDLKGRLLLPRIWSKVLSRESRARLTLVGTGATEEQVRTGFPAEVRESLAVIPRVTDAGQMKEIYGQNGVFLMPSLSEGSPLSLLEAMSAGLPAVAARVGGIPDIVMDGASALLFDSMDVERAAEMVVCLMDDPELASRIGASASARAASLRWRKTAEDLLAATHGMGGAR
jgi:glycosyltransferase involved in cell wall biosynthesis